MTETLPNKCDFCGLRVLYRHHSSDGTTSIDEAFTQLHQLKARGIIKHVPPRNIGVSNLPGDFGSTAFCAVNSKAWKDHIKPCKHWALKIDDASVADYLSIYHEKRSRILTVWVGIAAIVVAIITVAVQAAIRS